MTQGDDGRAPLFGFIAPTSRAYWLTSPRPYGAPWFGPQACLDHLGDKHLMLNRQNAAFRQAIRGHCFPAVPMRLTSSNGIAMVQRRPAARNSRVTFA